MFEENDVHAVNAALASGRPLLLRGKPGTGKSQLALAAAVGLGRALVSTVIDARTESRDLLWRFDAIRRLADAQAASSARLTARQAKLVAEKKANAGGDAEDDGRYDVLHERFYTAPGPLWWAFDWPSAKKQAQDAQVPRPIVRPGCDPEQGVVVLLDEIDKADSSVPNGLLGALGDGLFSVPGFEEEVRCCGVRPLVVITTNDERSLPDAFLRRCAIHRLALPGDDERLRLWLLRLAEAHFPGLDPSVREDAASMVLEDRKTCQQQEVNLPGGAEYLDLLRAVATPRTPNEKKVSAKEAKKRIGQARQFLLRKHVEAPAAVDEGR